ncbi:nicotinate phosphoribosyltransferase [Hoeflea prorocentri]|uniref:Nicotinamide phosphoribosyltransferase n=1 Tax=Hoeflea prorocentri TaxID=1922333 RepID=A0A9X3ZJR1_9HYPH|nr:nicotinate phosphoribosyltransferase [Hoeflea prorocentri]MCY6383070.1 nicotinate phosphoribosyltransferase [Hoeflea prorocentri]MDA5400870.1 nicotinate phosphoribosyltransferase [Hoeflea prorocentri]
MNMILNTDSYKYSHFAQYPPETAAISAYIESRPGGRHDHVLFFGLQMFLKEYLTRRISMQDVDDADELVTAHGLPFNREGWELLVNRHGGSFPLLIEALPEGSIAPVGTPLVQIRNTDPDFFWLPTFIETALLRAVWYPATVATVSHYVRRIITTALERSCDDYGDVLPFRLHDFGARGATSLEQAGIGGVAHLVSFMGTDTVSGLVYARRYYGEEMAGFSIPAAEHSTMTAWGEEREAEAYGNMIEAFGGEGKMVAVVSDSYDLYRAVSEIWGKELRSKVEQMGGTLVVRPDSGDPQVVPVDTVDMLGSIFGHSVNNKGYKVLNPAVRVIQGDGVTPETIRIILDRLMERGWSAENIAFGMGAGLLQKVNRDTLRFAMKANARQDTSGKWTGIHKDPKTDPGKASKPFRQAVICENGDFAAVPLKDLGDRENLMQPVWEDGQLLKDWKFSEIRERAAKGA